VPDTALFAVYRDLIALRKQNLRLLVDGTLSWLLTDDDRGLLAYERVLGDRRAIVAFNVSGASHEVSVAAADGRYRIAFPAGGAVAGAGGRLRAKMPPQGARVWIRESWSEPADTVSAP
jgi:glycosidase